MGKCTVCVKKLPIKSTTFKLVLPYNLQHLFDVEVLNESLKLSTSVQYISL